MDLQGSEDVHGFAAMSMTKNKHKSTSAASKSEQAETRLENANTKPFMPMSKTNLPEKAKSELI
ncbi:hypothetical protein FRC11_014910, partial [Ceratobasidium sp. 423]